MKVTLARSAYAGHGAGQKTIQFCLFQRNGEYTTSAVIADYWRQETMKLQEKGHG